MSETAAEAYVMLESGIVYSGDGIWSNFLLGLDKLNDPSIAVFEGQDNTGKKLLPSNDYDASSLALNGFMRRNVRFRGGLYYEVDESGGAVEAVFDIRPEG